MNKVGGTFVYKGGNYFFYKKNRRDYYIKTQNYTLNLPFEIL